jgi:hypothetical protein
LEQFPFQNGNPRRDQKGERMGTRSLMKTSRASRQ